MTELVTQTVLFPAAFGNVNRDLWVAGARSKLTHYLATRNWRFVKWGECTSFHRDGIEHITVTAYAEKPKPIAAYWSTTLDAVCPHCDHDVDLSSSVDLAPFTTGTRTVPCPYCSEPFDIQVTV